VPFLNRFGSVRVNRFLHYKTENRTEPRFFLTILIGLIGFFFGSVFSVNFFSVFSVYSVFWFFCTPLAFLFTIWLDELRKTYWERILSIQRWAFYCKLWDACLDDLAIPWKLMITYLKSIVSTGGKSMIDWQSRMRLIIENLLMSWQDAYNQSKSKR